MDRVEKIEDIVKPGDVLRAEVISLDREARKIGLSAKTVAFKGDREESAQYGKSGSAKTSLGDVFGDQLKLKKD